MSSLSSSSRRGALRAVLLSTTITLLGTASCASILGFEPLEEGSAPPNEAGTNDVLTQDAEAAAPDAPTGPCGEIGLPEPPLDAAPGNVPAVLGALRLFDFGIDVDGGRPQVPGFNLDRKCSVDVSTSSCRTKLLESTFETHAKDKNAVGLDNAGFSLIEYISRFSDVLSAKGINDGIAEGLYGGVFRLDQWNGQPDDDSVTIELFPALGFQKNGDGGLKPSFNENDRWYLDNRYQVGGVLEASSIKSDRAYVTANHVVGRFKEVIVPVSLADDPKLFDVRITDAVIAATIGKDVNGKPAIVEGVVAGRWRSADFLSQVRTIYIEDANGLTKTTLCDKVAGATVIYNSVKNVICDGRDIRGDSQDNKDLPCDAISVAARLETYSVTEIGTFKTPYDAGARCADAAIPLGDDCAPN